MHTTYLVTIKTAFNPFSRTAAVPRLFLQHLSAKAQKDIKIAQKVLPRTSTEPSSLTLGMKDGQQMQYTWPEGQEPSKQTRLNDIIQEVERHARVAGRKAELSG